ncbi:MAG: hypothetical protein ACPHY8_02085 [Patescibacteria group bacterium]
MQENTTNNQSLEKKQIILFKSVSNLDKANFFEYISVMVDG